MARRYELLLSNRFVEMGIHRGRCFYKGRPHKELLAITTGEQLDAAHAALLDTAHWAGEADTELMHMLSQQPSRREQ